MFKNKIVQRNKLIADRRYTDAIDELIIKFTHIPIKKLKIMMTEVLD